MDTINVALAGAAGNLVPAILNALLTDPRIKVTQLRRAGSKKGSDTRAPSREVDLTSLDSLTSALQGKDVLVNTLGFGLVRVHVHLRLIDASLASLAAGVQRVIPSEFGVDMSKPRTGARSIFQEKIDVQKHLREIRWIGGKFRVRGCGGDLDGGDQKFSTTMQAGAGRAVVGIVTRLEMTRNLIVYVREAAVSQKQLLRLAGERMVAIKEVRTVDLESQGYAEATRRAIFGDGFGSHFEEGRLANRLVGVKEMTEEELRGVVGKYRK
ncbi:hypothetical protein N7510_005959 [Penicillium lagena]|uniref:uncharacterized protein n=1 Tax=Penicillium lagena TaxID=94218 RepID=UPI00253FB794|nr:uncharacterized protein N7510_005959 [Penicillium lagena]KAJ5612765.1 hypothetical protein N7510_005959 [Penicillium lagena]